VLSFRELRRCQTNLQPSPKRHYVDLVGPVVLSRVIMLNVLKSLVVILHHVYLFVVITRSHCLLAVQMSLKVERRDADNAIAWQMEPASGSPFSATFVNRLFHMNIFAIL
jgi:hypothetical protein